MAVSKDQPLVNRSVLGVPGAVRVRRSRLSAKGLRDVSCPNLASIASRAMRCRRSFVLNCGAAECGAPTILSSWLWLVLMFRWLSCLSFSTKDPDDGDLVTIESESILVMSLSGTATGAVGGSTAETALSCVLPLTATSWKKGLETRVLHGERSSTIPSCHNIALTSGSLLQGVAMTEPDDVVDVDAER